MRLLAAVTVATISINCANAQNLGRHVFDITASPFNARCDGKTDDSAAIQAAVNAAASVPSGKVYTPRSSSYCLLKTTITVPTGTHGLSVEGDAPNGSIRFFSGWVGAPGIDVLHIKGVQSGDISNVYISNLLIWATGRGTAAVGLNIDNVLHFNVTNVTAKGPIGIRTAGSFGNFTNTLAYGFKYAYLSENSGTTNDGVIDWQGGQFTLNSCLSEDDATIRIKDSPLSVSVQAAMISHPGCLGLSVVRIDGSDAANVGAVSFRDMHCESAYNDQSDLSIYLIGASQKAGSVLIEGGNCWGQGNGDHHSKYFAKIVAAGSVTIRNVQVSRLGRSEGFSGGFIRLERNFASSPFAGGDVFDFRNNRIDNINGPLYSDARDGAPLSRWKFNATNNGSLDGYWETKNLPICAGNLRGLRTFVKDARRVTFNSLVEGNGENFASVICDGSRWVVM